MKYDSRPDTWHHIHRVRLYLSMMISGLLKRAQDHDQSKLSEPELPLFDEFTPLLKDTSYGTPEYTKSLESLGVALDHHYANNSHHPQYYPDGIRGMNLLDIVEMLCDWKASSERHSDGDIYKSIEINQERFGYSDDLKQILINTAKLLEKEKE